MELEIEIGTEIDEAKKAIDVALKLGADEAEIFLIKSGGTSFSIEKNAVGFASSGLDFGLGIRVLKSRKPGFSYCSKFEQAEAAIKQALAISKLGKSTDLSFTPSPSGTLPTIENTYDAKIPQLTPEEGLEKVTELIDSAKEVHPDINVAGGGVGYGVDRFAILNSNGLEVQDKGTGIFGGVSTVLQTAYGAATGFEVMESRVYDFDYSLIGRKGAELAVQSQNPKKLESGEMDVIFTPHAFLSLIEFTVIPSLYGEPARKGESVYSGKLGEQIAESSLSFIENGALANGLNSAVVDDEGVPSQRLELVKEGVLQSYLYDLTTATDFETESTSNAVRVERLGSSTSYKVPPGTKSRNFIIESKSYQAYDDLIKEVKNGLLVYDVMGAHTANPASGDFSVNSTILFKLEHGEVVHPCKQAMISGNMPEYLKHITGLGDDFKDISGGMTSVSVRIPSVRVGDVKVTS
jgi:PmbA protein